jgi:Na+/H+-dicarboxylate symporter
MNFIRKGITSLPGQLIFCIVLSFLFGHYLSVETIQYIYTFSFSLKEILMTVLPAIVFSYISFAILSLETSGSVLIVMILALVAVSNAVTLIVAYGVGKLAMPFFVFNKTCALQSSIKELLPVYALSIPRWLSSDKAMLFGIVYGMVVRHFKPTYLLSFSDTLQNSVNFFLRRCFIPLLPIYVTGFLLKMQYEGSLNTLCESFGQVLVVVVALLIVYIPVYYFVGSGFNVKRTIEMLKNMMPAALTGFSTISSAVTMPVTLDATEKNLGDVGFARLVIPLTVNFHMVGHSLSLPITSLALLKLFGLPLPTFEAFLLFLGFFCVAKFSASAVPGGGIIVMIEGLQKYLGFTPEMTGIIILLDILQDPLLTVGNVMGNGAFATIAHRVSKWMTSFQSRRNII